MTELWRWIEGHIGLRDAQCMTTYTIGAGCLTARVSSQDAVVARQTEELAAGGAQCAKLTGELAAAAQRGDDLLLASSGDTGALCSPIAQVPDCTLFLSLWLCAVMNCRWHNQSFGGSLS